MKQLSRDDNGYVFLVSREEHELMLELISLRARFLRRRNPGKLSRNDSGKPAADEELNRSLAQHRRHQAAVVKRLLKNKDICVPTESGFGLTTTRAEFEAILQTMNDINIRAWEALGCPDFEAGEQLSITMRNLLLVRVLHRANLIVSGLLQALNE